MESNRYDFLEYLVCLLVSSLIFLTNLKEIYFVKRIWLSIIYSGVFYFIWVMLKSLVLQYKKNKKTIVINNNDDLKYFLDLKEQYSLSELQYLYNGITDIKSIIITKVYEMISQNKIEIVSQSLKLLVSETELDEEEKIIVKDFNIIKENLFVRNYLGSVEKNLFDNNLFTKSDSLFYLHSGFNKKILYFVIIVLIYLFWQIKDFYKINYLVREYITLMTFILLAAFIFTFYFVFQIEVRLRKRKKFKHYERTMLGEEIYTKLNGLRNYAINHKLDNGLEIYYLTLNIDNDFTKNIYNKYNYLFYE